MLWLLAICLGQELQRMSTSELRALLAPCGLRCDGCLERSEVPISFCIPSTFLPCRLKDQVSTKIQCIIFAAELIVNHCVSIRIARFTI